jgi:hypothetical protein
LLIITDPSSINHALNGPKTRAEVVAHSGFTGIRKLWTVLLALRQQIGALGFIKIMRFSFITEHA